MRRSLCYKLVQGLRVTCLFTGQYNTKGYDLYLYELVGECVYLNVGQGRDGRGKVGRTSDDWGKAVMPLKTW